MVIRPCEQCSKPVKVSPSKMNRRTYCSRACFHANRNTEYQCERCGKEFTDRKILSGRKRFCSVRCRHDSQRKPEPPKVERASKKVDRICAKCGKAFQAFPSRVGRYCSRTCKYADTARRNTGRRTRSQVVQCWYCGKSIHKPNSRLGASRQFCGNPCYHAWDALYKSSPEMLARLADRLRNSQPSKLENRVAQWLTNHGLTFDRQVLLKVYTIDFKVRDCYVEVQGCYWHGCRSCFKDQTPRQHKRATRDKSLVTYCQRRDIPLLVIWEHDIDHGDFSALMPLVS